jgi:hypothetical protein
MRKNRPANPVPRLAFSAVNRGLRPLSGGFSGDGVPVLALGNCRSDDDEADTMIRPFRSRWLDLSAGLDYSPPHSESDAIESNVVAFGGFVLRAPTA